MFPPDSLSVAKPATAALAAESAVPAGRAGALPSRAVRAEQPDTAVQPDIPAALRPVEEGPVVPDSALQIMGRCFDSWHEAVWVEDSLRAVGMLEYRTHSPNKLSGGQKQRVAIAGVIAMEPKCIVLDEPTAMLDPNGRREVIDAVEKLQKKKNVTVILITHYMEEVTDADQVFVMDDGHIVMHGTPREIFSRVDELKRYRMDVPQVTMLAEELRNRGLDLPRGILRREELVEALCQLS